MNETITTTMDVEVTVRNHNTSTSQLTEAAAAGAKLTKADAGRTGNLIEDSAQVIIDSFQTDMGFAFPKVEIEMSYKVTNNAEAAS